MCSGLSSNITPYVTISFVTDEPLARFLQDKLLLRPSVPAFDHRNSADFRQAGQSARACQGSLITAAGPGLMRGGFWPNLRMDWKLSFDMTHDRLSLNLWATMTKLFWFYTVQLYLVYRLYVILDSVKDHLSFWKSAGQRMLIPSGGSSLCLFSASSLKCFSFSGWRSQILSPG